ncbi:MAG: MiaB/RimO family radical SAM methylthiotransferase, partial [Oscillospiraceae bacterium]
VAGTGDRMAFLDEVERLARNKTKEPSPCLVDDVMARRNFEFLPAGGLSGRTRAMLKVEDGCVNFCSYCIIPYARGPIRSLPLCDAVTEAKRLADEGFRELVITGIEISSWGLDLRDGTTLIDLMEAISAAAPSLRLRLGSLEPRTITEDFCRRAAALPNLCPHFHLSLQSGCDTVLKRMNRKYDTERYFQSVSLLRNTFQNPGITTDLIVGFPGETEEEFDQTLRFITKCGFSALHIFPYSRRPGTPADSMEGQCSNAVKENRAHRAGAVAKRLETAYLENLVGTTQTVLFETVENGLFRGHAGNYTEIFVPGQLLHNQTRQVAVTKLQDGKLLGALLNEEVC